MIPLVSDQDVYNIPPDQFRFMAACQHYCMFKRHLSPQAGDVNNRFFWISYADCFLWAIVSLQDLIKPDPKLYGNPEFRLLKVMRNITVHQAAVGASSPLMMVNRHIAPTMAGVREEPYLVGHRIVAAMDEYEKILRGMPKGKDKKTGKPRTMWNFEGKSVIAARKWGEELDAKTPGEVPMSEVFLDVIKFVAARAKWTLPDLS